MILLLGARTDPQISRVSGILHRESVDHLVMDPDAPSLVGIQIGDGRLELEIDGRSLSACSLAWLRAKLLFRRFGTGDDFQNEYTIGIGWRSYLENLVAILGSKVVNSGAAIHRCNNRLIQLILAQEIGFDVPDTCVTNHRRLLDRLLGRHESIVVKALAADPTIPSDKSPFGSTVIMTSRVDRTQLGEDCESIKLTPSLFQAEISKQIELRVAVFGQSVHAFSCDSQAFRSTSVDWRYGSGFLKFEPYDLPPDIVRKLLLFMERMDLFEGHFDFILDRTGRYVFLECNPVGVWAWLDDVVGGRLSQVVATELRARAEGLEQREPYPSTGTP